MTIKTLDKHGSLLIVSTWILMALTLLAIILAHRASVSLKLSRYQRDILKARYLAYAGVQKAILELKIDKDPIDSLKEAWSSGLNQAGEPLFENIELKPGSQETFTLGFPPNFQGNGSGIIDEERKINLNSAPLDMLRICFENIGWDRESAQALARLICIWRGDTSPELDQEAKQLEFFKKEPVAVPEELLFVFEYYFSTHPLAGGQDAETLLEHLRKYGTVLGDVTKININTASPEVISVLITTCLETLQKSGISINPNTAPLMDFILTTREQTPFATVDLENAMREKGLDDTELLALIQELKNFIGVTSQNFHVFSTGKIAQTNITRWIDCIFNRPSGQFLYWRQN